MYKVTTLSKRNSKSTFIFFTKKDAEEFVERCNKRGVKTVRSGSGELTSPPRTRVSQKESS